MINVAITASIQGLTSALEQATRSVKQNTDAWSGSFGNLAKTVDNLKAPFLALSAVLGGGALFGSAIKAAGEWNGQAAKMAKTLGTTTEEASALNVALDDLGIEQQTYTNASIYMTRQLAKGGEAFERLGIATKDAQGNMRPIQDLMRDAIDKLTAMKAGVDRNAAGLQLFGKGWVEAQGILRLTREEMDAARRDAERLHLVVGPEGAAMAREYKRTMGDLDDVMLALKVQVGNQLMPTFVSLGKWLAEQGPAAVTVLNGAIKGLAMGFMALKFVVETVLTTITALIMSVIDGFAALGRAFVKMIQGDYSGAVEELKQGASDVKNDWVAAGDTIADSWERAVQDINEAYAPTPRASGKAEESTGDGRFDPEDPDARKRREAKETADMAAGIKAREQLALAALDEERRILEEEVAAHKVAGEEKLAQESSLETQRYMIKKQTLEALLELNKEEPTKRMEINAQLIQLEEDHLRKLAQMRRTARDTERELELASLETAQRMALAGVELERQTLATQRDLNKVSAQEEIQALLDLEAQKYRVRRMAMEAMLAIEDLEPKKREEIQAQLFELEQEYATRRMELNAQVQQQYQELANRFLEPFVRGFQDGIQKMLDGTLSFKDAVQGIFGMLKASLKQAIANIVADWIAGLAKKLAAWIATKTTELIFHESTEAAKTTTTVANATTRGTAMAVEGGIAAGASAAQTPGIGWLIALPVAGAVIGGLLAYLAMASAAGGYDIPGGVNPVVQAHAREMILPAKYADVIRRLSDQEPGTSDSPGVVNVNISALDGADVERVLRRNEGELLRVLGDAVRKGRRG